MPFMPALLTAALLVTALPTPAGASPPPPTACIVVDTDRDALSTDERSEAIAALTLALRDRGIDVVTAPCPDTLHISTTRQGDGYVARVTRGADTELGRAQTVGALMGTYPDMVAELYPIASTPAEGTSAPSPSERDMTRHGMVLRGMLGSVDDSTSWGKGLGGGYRYDGARYLIDIGMHLTMATVGGDDVTARAGFSVGGAYLFLRDSPHSPYLGGGIAAGFTGFEATESFGGGLEGVVTAGGAFFRHSPFPFIVQLDCYVPFYDVDGASAPLAVLGSIGIQLTP